MKAEIPHADRRRKGGATVDKEVEAMLNNLASE
jgi:hypothetical protein